MDESRVLHEWVRRSVEGGREERLERLEQAVDQLPSGYREILLLNVIQRIPSRQIGARLGLTTPTVRMLRTRALRELRHVFGDTKILRVHDSAVGEEHSDTE